MVNYLGHHKIKWNKICKKKYLSFVHVVDGKWIFPSTPGTHERYLYSVKQSALQMNISHFPLVLVSFMSLLLIKIISCTHTKQMLIFVTLMNYLSLELVDTSRCLLYNIYPGNIFWTIKLRTHASTQLWMPYPHISFIHSNNCILQYLAIEISWNIWQSIGCWWCINCPSGEISCLLLLGNCIIYWCEHNFYDQTYIVYKHVTVTYTTS